MRYALIVLGMLFCSVNSALAQVSIGIGFPGVSIGINVPVYPQLVRVPGYPVYYAPRLQSNFFFYDGMYWVYEGDNWYASTWYNGPWSAVDRDAVPLFVLRVPVRYYRDPPAYFHGWQSNQPPRWGERWGHDWEQRRSGWNKWDRKAAPAPAPLPRYQRQYSGDRYPRADQQQREVQSRNYRYQPREPVVRQHYQERAVQRAPAPQERGSRQQPAQAPAQRQQQAPRSSQEKAPQGKAAPQERGQEQGRQRQQDDQQGRGRSN